MMISGRGRAKIRPPRRGNGDSIDFEDTWNIIRTSFLEIHQKNASSLSYEELYRHAYRLVLKKRGAELYQKVVQFERTWLSEHIQPIILSYVTDGLIATRDVGGAAAASATENRVAGEKILKAINERFLDHKTCMGMLSDVLMYLDRVYCVDNREPSIYVVAMGIFLNRILRSETSAEGTDNRPTILEILNGVILNHIRMERDGDVIEKYHIKTCVNMLESLYEDDNETEDLRLYQTAFEPEYLTASREFYRAKGEEKLRDNDAGAYGEYALNCIEEEAERCRTTLSESTAVKIQQVVEDELIKNNIHDLVEMPSGVQFMIDNDRLSELKSIYDLNTRVDPQKTEIVRAMQKRVVEMGTELNDAAITAAQPQPAAAEESGKPKPSAEKLINQHTSAALKWVEDVLALKDKFDKIWKMSFASDPLMQTALTRSFAEFINATNMTRSSEYISLFIDENMKRGIKDKSELEVDMVLEKAIVLLRYIQDKDIFETYYKKHLAKRLLMGKSLSIDVEKLMISRMKIELGHSFTQKLETMFKDMSLSADLTTNFKDYVNSLGKDPQRIDLSINVLTNITWPQELMGRQSDDGDAKLKCVYPPAIERIKQSFEQFYNSKHQGRKLTWMPHMGNADIKATFPKNKEGKERRYDINVPTYSMIILVLFDELPAGASLTYEEIQAQTNIPHHDLQRNLQSLAIVPKTRILLKEPTSRDIKNTDSFSLNETFTSKFYKIKVGLMQAGNKVEGKEQRKETEKKANDSRKYVIEAAVVRIMKQRKFLPHGQLVTETLTQLSAQFKPDVAMIKKQIESLIDREYLERDEKAAVPSYKYLA